MLNLANSLATRPVLLSGRSAEGLSWSVHTFHVPILSGVTLHFVWTFVEMGSPPATVSWPGFSSQVFECWAAMLRVWVTILGCMSRHFHFQAHWLLMWKETNQLHHVYNEWMNEWMNDAFIMMSLCQIELEPFRLRHLDFIYINIEQLKFQMKTESCFLEKPENQTL